MERLILLNSKMIEILFAKFVPRKVFDIFSYRAKLIMPPAIQELEEECHGAE